MSVARRVGVSLVVLLLGACGEAPGDEPGGSGAPAAAETALDGLRRVVPLWPEPPASGADSRLDEAFDGLALGEGAQLEREVEVLAGLRYTVRVDHEGPAPRLRGGAVGLERVPPLPPVPGPLRPGITQALLRPTQVDGPLRLELEGADGLVISRLQVRAWGNAGDAPAAVNADPAEAAAAPAPVRREVGGEFRPCLVLLRGSRHVETVQVPVGATRLELGVAALGAGGEAPAPRAPELLVELAGGAAGRVVSRVETPHRPAEHGAAWERVSLPLPHMAGGEARLVLQVRGGDDDGPALLVSTPTFLCESGARRPNLVLLSIDTLRPDHLGLHGYARDTSPRMDALGEQAVVFEQATSTAPFTLPSHASMFSGQYPSTHGAEHPAHAVGDDVPWLAGQLAARGWATRAFTGGGYLHPDYGFARGFAEYSALEPVFELPAGDVPPEAPAELRALLAARRAVHWSAALDWVERHRELPFLLVLHTFAVHDYRPRAEHRELFATPGAAARVDPLRRIEAQVDAPYDEAQRKRLVDLYDGALRGVDAHVGELLDTLRRLQLDEHTVVVITSDHGEILGEHSLRGVPLVGHSWSLYDSLLRVPLIVRAPGVAPARVRERVSAVDLAPTLLDLLGLEAPDSMQGVSLRPWLEGRRAEVRPSPVLAEVHSHYSHAEALVAGPHKVLLADPAAPVQFPDEEPVRLFDLRADPQEQRSVHVEQADAAEALAETLRGLRERLRAARAGDPAEADLGAATLEQLRALGYLDG